MNETLPIIGKALGVFFAIIALCGIMFLMALVLTYGWIQKVKKDAEKEKSGDNPDKHIDIRC